jgi:hypothetical protein
MLFAGPFDLPSECENTTCFAWPIVHLRPGQLVVALRAYRNPLFTPPSGGDPITVAGLAARRIDRPADAACRAIDGTRLVQVWLPPFGGATGVDSIDACLSGDSGAATATFAMILASVI